MTNHKHSDNLNRCLYEDTDGIERCAYENQGRSWESLSFSAIAFFWALVSATILVSLGYVLTL